MFSIGLLETIKASDIIAVVDLSTAISMRRAKVYAERLCRNSDVINCKGTPKSAVIISGQDKDKVIFLSISATAVKSRILYKKRIEGISYKS
jgi:hypothetical protein